jgi:hypothetical protein
MKMIVYVFGNGNTSFEDFQKEYVSILKDLEYNENLSFVLGDFRGIDTLIMEYLKTKTRNVTVFHVGNKPRYFPDKFKTYTKDWKLKGGFKTDLKRDNAAINECTHFLAEDYNSDENRKSGTLKNIERSQLLNKIRLK